MKRDRIELLRGAGRTTARRALGECLLAAVLGAISTGGLFAEGAGEPVPQRDGDAADQVSEANADPEPDAQSAVNSDEASEPAATSGSQPSQAAERQPDPDAPTTTEQRVLDQVNAERERWGRRPLKLSHRLMRVARRHAANMARWNTMSHYLGGSVAQRIAASGYSVRFSGENIAQGQRGAQQVMSTWLASAGHRNNILSTGYTEIGVAVAYTNQGTPYWVQVFATP